MKNLLKEIIFNMNVFKITYDNSITWSCILANDMQEAMNIFSKEINKCRTTKAKIISIETIATNTLYDVSKIAKDAYNEGYKDGVDNFMTDINVVYNNLK